MSSVKPYETTYLSLHLWTFEKDLSTDFKIDSIKAYN